VSCVNQSKELARSKAEAEVPEVERKVAALGRELSDVKAAIETRMDERFTEVGASAVPQSQCCRRSHFDCAADLLVFS
jgi:hypothetical protein